MSPLAHLFRARPARHDSVIAAGTTITGTVRGHRRLLVEGTLDGDASAGTIVVAPGGRIDGDTSADLLHVAGSVTGAAQAGLLQVADGGSFSGDALYERLEVAAGAVFEATCRSLPAPEPAVAAGSAPRPRVAPVLPVKTAAVAGP